MNNINKNLSFIFFNKLKYIIDWDNPICINKYELPFYEDTLSLIPYTEITVYKTGNDIDNALYKLSIRNSSIEYHHINVINMINILVCASFMTNYNNIEY